MIEPRRIGLVGCVKRKRATPAPARDLYTSALFLGRRAYVERTCDAWFILSAEHGLVDPNAVLAPYDKTLNDMTPPERREWSARVLLAVHKRVGALAGVAFEIHAGKKYCAYGLADGLQRAGATVVPLPVDHLGIGLQVAWYQHANAAT